MVETVKLMDLPEVSVFPRRLRIAFGLFILVCFVLFCCECFFVYGLGTNLLLCLFERTNT